MYIKKIAFLVILSVAMLMIQCESKADNPFENPKVLAEAVVKIYNAGNNEEKESQVFKEYGFNRIEGYKLFNAALKKVKEDKTLYEKFEKERNKLNTQFFNKRYNLKLNEKTENTTEEK